MNLSGKKLTVIDQIASSDKVRKKIIDAASILYVQKGFTATSIEEIAEAAGVSLPVTYRYVKKKSEIMEMIMEDVLNIFQESLKNQIRHIEDPEEKLALAVALYCRVMDQQQEKVLLIYQKSNSLDKPARARIMQLEVAVSEIFGSILREGIKKGVFQDVDVDLAAYNIIMMASLWILKRWHFKQRLSIDTYIDLQLPLLLNMLKK